MSVNTPRAVSVVRLVGHFAIGFRAIANVEYEDFLGG